MMPTALIVDDEQSIQKLLRIFFEREGFSVDCASTISDARGMLNDKKYDLIVADIYLENSNGLDLLRTARTYDKHAQVVMITGVPDTESAVEALRLGAFDYLSKPLVPQQIIATARRALHNKMLREDSEHKQANLNAIFHSASDGIILIDRDNRLVQVNDAAMSSCGYTQAHLGLPILSIESGCGGTCRQALANVLRDGARRSIRRLECCKRNMPKRIVSLSVSPVIESNGIISGAVAIVRNETELDFLEKQYHRQSGFGDIIGKNSAMQRMFTLIQVLADVQTTVLVNGESGTGKELVAAALHHQGARRDKPFVKVNCSALSENLLESELFGHVRGAFTGAVTSKIGRFQKADGGTIFLDEIGDISLSMQMRLLRVLQEQEFEPVGDSTPIKVDVRVVAATNQDLAEKVHVGTFRRDLYYRLNVVRLIIPPLRDRRDDIPLLVEHFLGKFSHKFQKPLNAATNKVMELFMSYPWPGNVRELEHIVEHAAVLCPASVITVEDLPQDFTNYALHGQPEEILDTRLVPGAKLSIAEALEKSGGNKAKAARLLGVSRCTLYRWLQVPASPSSTL